MSDPNTLRILSLDGGGVRGLISATFMASTTAQLQLTTSLRLTQTDLLTLSSKPVVIVPASAGFINIFEKATLTYNYKTTAFANLNNLLGKTIA